MRTPMRVRIVYKKALAVNHQALLKIRRKRMSTIGRRIFEDRRRKRPPPPRSKIAKTLSREVWSSS